MCRIIGVEEVEGYTPFSQCLIRGMTCVITCAPVKFFRNAQFGSVEPVKLAILFSSPLLNFHPKVLTKLHDSVSRIQNFPVSEVTSSSDTPCAH